MFSTSPMKNLTRTICLTLAVLLGGVGTSWSADYDKGLAAYESGDYATALREWKPLAEQGNAGAIHALALSTQTIEVVKEINAGLSVRAQEVLTDVVRHYYEVNDPSGIHFAGKSNVRIPTALWDRIISRWRAEGVMPDLIILQARGGAIVEGETSFESVTESQVATESPSSADYDKGLAAYKSDDYATALRELRPLAEQGHVDAQTYLGLMYQYGEGVAQDNKTALKWYTLAAEQGDADAQLNLGYMYEEGAGIPQDYKTALKWYTLAAEQGDVIGQLFLGVMYKNGDGVPQDNVYAHMWGSVAASQRLTNSEDGGKLRDLVAKSMTPTQIEKAEKLASECIAKKFKGC